MEHLTLAFDAHKDLLVGLGVLLGMGLFMRSVFLFLKWAGYIRSGEDEMMDMVLMADEWRANPNK